MVGKIKHLVRNKFCMELGKYTTKTLEMLCEAFGENSLSWTVVFQRHSRFTASQVSVVDERSERQAPVK
jgi:hypothetical protein